MLALILLILAAICFLVASFPRIAVVGVNLVPLGLLLATCSVLLGQGAL